MPPHPLTSLRDALRARFGSLSLSARLLIAASAVLVVFMLLTGAGLEQAFERSAFQSQRARLEGLVYALLAAADTTPRGSLSVATAALPDSRLTHVDSGLEAVIFDARGVAIWHSPSLSDPLPAVTAPPVGTSMLTQADGRFVFAYGVNWYGNRKKARRFTLALIEDQTDYLAQLATYRQSLWVALGAASAVLVLLQMFLLRWSLSPLRHLAVEVRQIESGKRDHIERVYPAELLPLTQNLNTMISTERSQLVRYRNALGDLAHSLKTPLAVLRGVAEASTTPHEFREQIEDPIARMEHIAGYQLHRAAAAGRRALSERVALAPLAGKVLEALTKVYADRGLELRNAIDPELRLRADEGDLYEIVGNLADNACKWARHTVILSATAGTQAIITAEDDGPGFPDGAEKLLERGVRADTHVSGQGIGLATIHDIVQLSGGQIKIGRSDTLGGARISVHWPN
ncbi:MAG: HAMP domain-containing protein [Nevskiaceae bacterium]|nr:MAG: HAMP domain-containing protein [Nevskiaceae bacterium]TBR74009.1 MAG: HAMP domain-containing protein [Nevskiaceae bacterium]